MTVSQRKAGRWGIAFTVAASLLISNLPLAFAAPGDTNSVNTGQNIQGGTYYNTADSRTTFQNPGGDLILGAGTTVRGLEVNGAGQTTGNGGNMLFSAPNGMFRLDGNVDVSAAMNGGIYTGNGGHIQIEAAALYQNGSIFAQGINGGTVQMNVGAMTMGPNAQINATGQGGAGGVVDIKAANGVDIARAAIIDTSGKVIGAYNTNVIKIEGGLVNLDGVLRSNGLVAGEKGGVVTLVALNGNVNIGTNGTVTANGADGAQGGVIGISASDSVVNSGTVSANGGSRTVNASWNTTGKGGDGGVAVLLGGNRVDNAGSVTANGNDGGNGGVVAVGAKNTVTNNGTLSANGGDGFYSNNSSVNADGGRGGLVLVAHTDTIVNAMNSSNAYQAMRDGAGTGNLVNNGTISADGGNGFTGWNPTSGGNGGAVDLKSGNRLDNNGVISVNGGHGGFNADDAIGPVIDAPQGGKAQTSLGQDGGHGGNAGSITLSFKKDAISNNGVISAIGGKGGNGQNAVSNDPKADNHYAVGGNGGNGGNGGFVEFYGLPSQSVLNNTKVDGGHGGSGGTASPKDCSCGGNGGACGTPGEIVIHPPKELPPPPTPPNTPTPPPYPKDNLRVGDALPVGGPVLSYNRSIFLARAPLPIIQKRKPIPAPPPPPPAPVNPKPKPVPPKRRVPVRGYW